MSSIKAVFVAILFLVTFSGVPFPPSAGTPPVTLGVPLIPQHGFSWCWAATSEMCMAYYRASIDSNAPFFTQCELGKKWFIYYYSHKTPPNDSMLRDTMNFPCAPDLVEGSVFDLTAQPYFSPYSPADWMPYYTAPTLSTPLNWDQLCDTFRAKIPIIFQWTAVQRQDTTNQPSHVMVAEGCSQMPSALQYQWVSVIDPWPVDDTTGERVARHCQMAYSDYENTSRSTVIGVKGFVWRYRGCDWVISHKKRIKN